MPQLVLLFLIHFFSPYPRSLRSRPEPSRSERTPEVGNLLAARNLETSPSRYPRAPSRPHKSRSEEHVIAAKKGVTLRVLPRS